MEKKISDDRGGHKYMTDPDCDKDKVGCMRWHIYPFVFLHIVQVCFLTNAQIEKFLPLISHWISLSLEWGRK